MKINLFFKCLASFCLFFVLVTCALFVRPPAEPGLEQMSTREVNRYDWGDDLNFKGLETAVDQSIRYYEKLPPGKTFQYGGLKYSPEEMLASLKLFGRIIKGSGGKEAMRQLREKFLFFESRNREGKAFFTGYYEPLVEGSLFPTEKFTAPVYRTPGDLVEADLGQFAGKWKNEKIVGRLKGGRLVPYDSREEIVYGHSLEGRAEVIAYVDEIELFFLQVQGSGLVRLPDGKVKRINYDKKNGRPYKSIGKILKERIAPDEVSLQSIKAYLYENPDKVREILTHNQSYVFFREVEEGPLGYIEVPLTPNRSIAMDWKVIPRGGPAFIETEIPVFKNGKVTGWKPLKRFVLVQDTGGAIRGHGRVDIFFGHDKNAELLAGHLQQGGRVFLIVARKEFL
ncbi:MAG TPA: transglycosylase [Nitrospirae bacterium]|nr:transglycosylase [Nitrospirota bacterium]